MKAILVLTLSASLFGAEYYVATDGSSSNSGTINSPWDRASVFAEGNPKNLQPGDVIHFRGGTYDGTVDVYGDGAAGNLITFQNYAGETVIFDYSNFTVGDPAGANVRTHPTSSYLRFRKNPNGGRFVIANSNTQRVFTDDNVNPNHADFCYPTCRPDGLNDLGDYNEVLNLEIHDTGIAITSQSGACGGRYQGNIIYYNGWESPNIAVGNDFYLQQPAGCADPKVVEGNIEFGNHQWPQAYGSSGSLIQNIQFKNNINFNMGQLAADVEAAGFLVGGIGTAAVSGNTITGNVLFNTLTNSTRRNMLRFYTNACTTCTVSNNYLRAASGGGNALSLVTTLTGLTETGNIFVGTTQNSSADEQFPNSTFLGSETTDRVFDIGGGSYTRALVVVDGTGNGSVSWTPTNCGSSPALELREMMNYTTATADQTLTCGAGAQTITMAYGGSILSAVGNVPNAAVHTGTAVRVFLVTGTSAPVSRGFSGSASFSGSIAIQ